MGSSTNNSTLDFVYSATGEKLAQILTTKTGPGDPTYPSTSTKQVDYISGFIYGQSDHLVVTTPTGRAIFEPNRTQPDKWVQEYHLRDHQGSLRLAFRGGGMDLMASATMEPTASLQEEQQFDHLAETRLYDPAHARTGNYSSLLNAKQHGVGPSLTIHVKAGDSLHIEAFGRYDTNIKAAPTAALIPVVAFGSNVTNENFLEKHPASQPGLSRKIAFGIGVALDRFVGFFHRKESIPQAYVRYNLYNKDSVLIKSEVKSLSNEANNSWQQLVLNTTPKEDGYIVIALENNSGKNAYFDDLSISTAEDMIVQENHYDPFGQNLVDIEMLGSPDAKTQYTGKERIGDLGLEWAYYGARMYDNQLGRWHTTDPVSQYASPFAAMGNNPVNKIDADGKFAFVPLIPIIIGAIIGGYSGYSYGKATGASGWALAGYTVGGAVIGGYSGGMSSAIMGSGTVAYGTLSLFAGSFINSVGMNILTMGHYSNRLDFGAASIDMASGEIGFLGKKGNSSKENWGYAMGAFTNISDGYGAATGAYGDNTTDYDLVTKNEPIGHSEVYKDDVQLLTFSPKNEHESIFKELFKGVESKNVNEGYYDNAGFPFWVTDINVTNVKPGVIEQFARERVPGALYSVLNPSELSCVRAASIAFLKAGVFNIPFLRHPITLELQMLLRQNPYYSQYLIR